MYITDLRDEDIELSVKVVIVGNGAVGKSSMIQVRFHVKQLEMILDGIHNSQRLLSPNIYFLTKQQTNSGQNFPP